MTGFNLLSRNKGVCVCVWAGAGRGSGRERKGARKNFQNTELGVMRNDPPDIGEKGGVL